MPALDDKVIEEMAETLANQIGMRKGCPPIRGCLALMPPHMAQIFREDAQACASILKKRIEGLVTAAERVDAYIRELGDFAGPDEQPIECFRQLRDALAALSPVGVTEA